MAQLLKRAEFANHNCVAQVNVGRGRIGAEFHAQRLAGARGACQLRAQFVLTNDLDCAFAQVRKLFVDGHELILA